MGKSVKTREEKIDYLLEAKKTAELHLETLAPLIYNELAILSNSGELQKHTSKYLEGLHPVGVDCGSKEELMNYLLIDLRNLIMRVLLKQHKAQFIEIISNYDKAIELLKENVDPRDNDYLRFLDNIFVLNMLTEETHKLSDKMTDLFSSSLSMFEQVMKSEDVQSSPPGG